LAATLVDQLAELARIHPERLALRDGQSPTALNYRELESAATGAARALLVRGVGRNDRIAVFADQTPEVWVALHGALRLGAVPVLVNWRLTVIEATQIVRDSGARLVVATDRWTDLARSVAEQCGAEVVSARTLVEEGATANASRLPDRPDPSDVAVQLYTSGTTSLPKWVCNTHCNVMGLLAVLSSELPGFAADTRHLVVAPLFHIAGFGFGVGALAVGAPIILLEQFDPAAVLDLIEAHRITHSLLVPAMLQAVVAVDGATERDASSLRGVLYGGSPMSLSLMRSVRDVLGCPLTQAYGMTETTGIATLLRFDDHTAGLDADAVGAANDDAALTRLASAGRVLPGTEVRIDDPDSSGAGEVLVRSAMVMSEYWNRPEANTSTIDADGWLHTGDIGRLDADGYLFLVDRKNDTIITKGENVFPGEVERVLVEHPSVRDVAVVGIPDDSFGEMLCAVVEAVPGSAPTLQELQAFARDRLAGFKLPRRLEIVDELPRTPSGKVMRRLVREPFWADQERRIH